MASLKSTTAALAALLLLEGCVQQPLGPTVQVMPAPGKPFDVFQQDQAVCKQYADQQTAGGAQQANNQALLTAGIGTVLGAGLGAAIGGGQGAAIGAGAGAITGTAYGAAPAGYAQMNLQQRYDASYSQCMYAHGDQVPGYQPAPPPPGYGAPPGYGQSPGYPPPPPPGYGQPGYYPR